MKTPVRILLLSDQLIHQQLIENLLTHMGHAFVTANNQDLAEYWLQHKSFDCALLDAHSQSNLALEMTPKIRSGQFRRQKNLALILLSSSADSKKIRDFAQLKVNDFLMPPLRMKALQAKIEQVLALKTPSQLELEEQRHWVKVLVQEIREHLRNHQEAWVATKAVRLIGLLQLLVKAGGCPESLLVWVEDLSRSAESTGLVHLEKSLYEIEQLMQGHLAA